MQITSLISIRLFDMVRSCFVVDVSIVQSINTRVNLRVFTSIDRSARAPQP